MTALPRSFAARLAAATLASLLYFTCNAQNWPAQPVKIVVPFTPGTGVDIIARTVSPKLSERLGQPVLVLNTPGASGNIGTNNVAKAAPDGYTVLLTANGFVMVSHLYKSVPFDPIKDFSPLTLAASGTLMLVASPKSGIKSMQEFVTRARSQPGQVTFGSPGVGTPHHMAMELFKGETGVSLLHVPYKGTAGYVQDLLGGEVMTGFLPVHVAQGFVKDGRLTALAVGSSMRHPAAPNVPSLQELGVNDGNVDIWYGFFLPSNVPAPVANRLQTELEAVLKLPDVRDALGKAGLDATSSSAAELGALVKKDADRWGAVIRKAGIKVE